MRRLILLLASCLAITWLPGSSRADEEPAVKWHWSVAPRQSNASDEVELLFTAEIPDGWILYSSDFKADLGPRPTKFLFDPNADVALVGTVQAVKPLRRTDRNFGTQYGYFEKQAQFRQKVRLAAKATRINGQIAGQACQEKDGLCTLYKQAFSVDVP